MARAVVTAGSAASFVVAAVAGVLGNQLTKDAIWAWVAFGAALVVGAAVTAFVAHRTSSSSGPGPGPGAAADPVPHTVEGPVAKGDVNLDGTYVAGHDITFTDTAHTRDTGRP
ncbi:MAG: hypothetical protein HOV94_15270 [Saccharothrix sp.]|nr:hypothetical protein [Saccharothrix sp.]